MQSELAEELMSLGATGRFKRLAERLAELHPGCLDDPARLPDEPAWLLDVVLGTLENSGSFQRATRFLHLVPSERIGEVPRQLLAERLAEKERVLGPMQTLLQARGRVTTVLGSEGLTLSEGPFVVRFVMDGDRVDVDLCMLALTRMSRKLLQRFGADPGPLDVEVHARPERFAARAAELAGRPLPPSIHGLAAFRERTLLVLHDLDPGRDPHALFLRLGHEYTHVAMRSLAAEGWMPAWLDEGLAIALTMELPGHLLRLWERAGAAALPLSDLERALPEAPGLRELACAQAAVAVQGLLVRGDRLLARGLAAGWDTQRWEQEAPAR